LELIGFLIGHTVTNPTTSTYAVKTHIRIICQYILSPNIKIMIIIQTG